MGKVELTFNIMKNGELVVGGGGGLVGEVLYDEENCTYQLLLDNGGHLAFCWENVSRVLLKRDIVLIHVWLDISTREQPPMDKPNVEDGIKYHRISKANRLAKAARQSFKAIIKKPTWLRKEKGENVL